MCGKQNNRAQRPTHNHSDSNLGSQQWQPLPQWFNSFIGKEIGLNAHSILIMIVIQYQVSGKKI